LEIYFFVIDFHLCVNFFGETRRLFYCIDNRLFSDTRKKLILAAVIAAVIALLGDVVHTSARNCFTADGCEMIATIALLATLRLAAYYGFRLRLRFGVGLGFNQALH
jgi:hypothetical protein